MDIVEGDVLGLLERLQQVADEIDRLEARRRDAEQEKDRVEQDVRQAEQVLEAQRERVHALDIERRKRELAIRDGKERIQRIKSRMADVKTSREYQAVLAEMSSAKQTVAQQEEALERDLRELENLQVQLEQTRSRLEDLRGALAQASERLRSVLEDTEQVISERRSEEQQILAALPADVVDRYRLIRSRRGGVAVVEARDEACTACYMRIPPQTYIEVMRKTRIIQCPNCHRILIPPKETASP